MIKKNQPISLSPWRFYIVCAIVFGVVLVLAYRMIDLGVFDQSFLRKQGNVRMLRVMNIPAFRGMISDRSGEPLAISTPVSAVWVNPHVFSNQAAELKKLSELLNISPPLLFRYIKHYKNKEFLYLKRGLSPELGEKIKALHLPGIYLQREYRRFYPEGEVAAHVVGFTNIDDQGQEGLELAYNRWLAGKPGKKWVIKDRIGRVIDDIRTLQVEEPGHPLELSIDRRIQFLAYRALKKAVVANKASAGSLIVLDVQTGEILAMVNQPSFNPNDPAQKNIADHYRNRAVTDVFEPGSTLKAFSVASALDSGKYNANTVINTGSGMMKIGKDVVRDEHTHGKLTVTEILKLSSNVGVAKMTLSLPPKQLVGLLRRVGFGEETDSHFPGERAGSLTDYGQWRPFELATLAFGYGISVTTLQLAQAYSILANEGVAVPISLLHKNTFSQGRRVMDKRIARAMIELLKAVTAEGGTGILANVPGYHVAGKTGTARMASRQGGYHPHDYISSFVGMAPATQPRLIVAVVIFKPQGREYYASLVAAPVFSEVMRETLRLLNIPPDNPTFGN